MELDAGEYSFEGESIRAITASASRDEDGAIHITVSNLDPRNARRIEGAVQGQAVRNVSGRILTADDMRAHNTCETPTVVAPKPFDAARLVGDRLTIDLPPMSLVVLRLQ